MPLLETIRDPRKKEKPSQSSSAILTREAQSRAPVQQDLPTPVIHQMQRRTSPMPAVETSSPVGLERFEAERPVVDEERRGRVQTALLVALGVGAAGAVGGGDLGDSLLALGAGGATSASDLLGGLDEEYIEQMDAYRAGLGNILREQERQASQTERTELSQVAQTERTQISQAGQTSRNDADNARIVAEHELDRMARIGRDDRTDQRENLDDRIRTLERSDDVGGLAMALLERSPGLSAEQALASAQASVARFQTDTSNRERIARGPVGRRTSSRSSGRRTTSRGRLSGNFLDATAEAGAQEVGSALADARERLSDTDNIVTRQRLEEEVAHLQGRMDRFNEEKEEAGRANMLDRTNFDELGTEPLAATMTERETGMVEYVLGRFANSWNGTDEDLEGFFANVQAAAEENGWSDDMIDLLFEYVDDYVDRRPFVSKGS